MCNARGGYSGMPASPHLNHRNANFNVMAFPSDKDGKAQPSVRDSCLNPGVGENFDEMTPLTIMMYESVPVEKDKDGKIVWSPTHPQSIKCSFDIRLEYHRETSPCYIKNTYAQPLSASSFRRLLAIFGYEWMMKVEDPKTKVTTRTTRVDDINPPSDFEVVGFLALFNDVSIARDKSWFREVSL